MFPAPRLTQLSAVGSHGAHELIVMSLPRLSCPALPCADLHRLPCFHPQANLNGVAHQGTHEGPDGINWLDWKGPSYSLKATRMMIN